MQRFVKATMAAAAVAFGLYLTPVSAQTAAFKPARLADGHPDLNGIWQAMNTANWDLEGHAAQASQVVTMGTLGAEPGGIGVVEGGKIPYLPAALAKKQENYKNRLTLDPEVKCYLPGVPRATYLPYPFQIFQSQSYIAIAYEYDSAFRNIYLKDPGPPPIHTWMAQSYGHWEGDTLVVHV